MQVSVREHDPQHDTIGVPPHYWMNVRASFSSAGVNSNFERIAAVSTSWTNQIASCAATVTSPSGFALT